MIARFEALKAWRSRRLLLAFLTLCLFVVLMLVGFYTYAQNETGGHAEFRYTFENSSYFNGLTFSIYAFYFAFLLLFPIFAATEGGAQIAGETSGGTLALMLTRPVGRARVFLTKFAVASLGLALSVGLFLAGTLAIGLLAVGWGDLDLYPGVLQMTDSYQHLEQSEALWRFVLCWPAASLALLVPLALAFLISSCAKSPVNAAGASVSTYLVLYVVSEIHFFEELRPFLFTSSMPYWRGLFRQEIEWGAILTDGAKLAGFGLLFLALALLRFRTRQES